MGLLRYAPADRRLGVAFVFALVVGAGIFASGLYLALDRIPGQATSPAGHPGPPPASSAFAGAPPLVASPTAAGLPGLDVMVLRLEEKLASGGTADQWLLLGRTYVELGRPADARRALERALAADPRLPGLAEAMRQAQDPAGAALAAGSR